jgi:hypothetical protein
MNLQLEYGFNNMPVTKFKKYEIKVINDIKYVVPVVDEVQSFSYDVIDYGDYQENDEPLIDFINLGKATLENPNNVDTLLIEYINKYGLLGLIHDLPVNRYYTLDKVVLLKEFNNITGKEYYDCFNTMEILDYFKKFFPTSIEKEINKLIEQTNKQICQHSMEKFITHDLNDLYYKNEKYFEQADMIIEYAQIIYKALLELKKSENEYTDTQLIERIETKHIRTNLTYDGITIHIRSLKEYIDEDFKLYAIQTKKYLKVCKHCGKAFIAKNPKTEYDTFSCKNQENVYKSRARKNEN